MVKDEVVDSEEGQMRLTSGKDGKWLVKEEVVDAPFVKEEVEDGELWGYGGYFPREDPDFVKNPEPKRRKVTSVVETNNYITQKELTAEVKEEAESFPFVFGHSMTQKSIQTGANLPAAEEGGVRGSFNVHDFFSNEAAVKKEEESQNAADERKNCPVDGCLEKFPSYPDLVKHMKSHPNPVVCGFCKKFFPKQVVLRQHYATHTGGKNFECPLCDYKAARPDSLKTHLRIHTKEKPFPCSFCDKSFGDSSTLTKHVRTHTGETPFACITCNKQFKCKNDLIRHTRTHSGETPYLCPSCDKRFKASGDLVRHTRIHTGEKPFACKNCEYNAAQSANLKAHKKKYNH